MSVSQIVRTNVKTLNNPNGIVSDVKPGRILADTVNPLNTVGELMDYYINTTTGDLFGPKTNIWGGPIYNFTTGAATGLTNIENNGVGAGIFKNIIGNTAHLKSLDGAINQINVTGVTDEVRLSMSTNYKPDTLDKVNNVFNEYGAAVPPTINNDSTQNFETGSTWTQSNGDLYVCVDASPGAAVWLQVGAPTPPVVVEKGRAAWESIGGQPQSILTTNFVDLNLGANTTPLNLCVYGGSPWSSLFDGTRQVFRTTSATVPITYNISYNMRVEDFDGATITEAIYDIRMVRKTGTFIMAQSYNGVVLPVSTASNRKGFITGSFVFQETIAGQQDYYLQIRGLRGGLPAPNINIDYWSVSFSEV